MLVPSSQFIMTLIPTFSDMTVESLVELQSTMEEVLMHKTQTIYGESSLLPPSDINVVIQDHVQIRYSTQTAFTVKTTNITFVVLGNFDTLSAETGPTFMDSIVSQTFERDTYCKDLFLSLLKESSSESLNQFLAMDLSKQLTDVILVDVATEPPAPTDTSENLTPLDISLIVVSALIFTVIVLVLVCSRCQMSKKVANEIAIKKPRHPTHRAASAEFGTVTSFDDAFSGPALFLQSESVLEPASNLSKQPVDPTFRILRHSPPNIFKSLSTTTVTTSNRSPTAVAMHPSVAKVANSKTFSAGAGAGVVMDSPGVGPFPSDLAMTPLNSLSSDSEAGHSSSAGDSSSGSFSEPFASKWFKGGSQTSFSVDSQDIFAVDVASKVGAGGDEQFFSSTSFKGQSMDDWTRAIRVVATNVVTSSVSSGAAIRSVVPAPQSSDPFPTNTGDIPEEGLLT